MTRPWPRDRKGYQSPPKVAGSVSVTAAEVRALAATLMGCLIDGRKVPAAEMRNVARVAKSARKSIERAKAKRAEFERGRSGR